MHTEFAEKLSQIKLPLWQPIRWSTASSVSRSRWTHGLNSDSTWPVLALLISWTSSLSLETPRRLLWFEGQLWSSDVSRLSVPDQINFITEVCVSASWCSLYMNWNQRLLERMNSNESSSCFSGCDSGQTCRNEWSRQTRGILLVTTQLQHRWVDELCCDVLSLYLRSDRAGVTVLQRSLCRRRMLLR